MDIRGGNRLLDHPFTFLSKQQLNLLSFSLLTSCSEKKKEHFSSSSWRVACTWNAFCPHVWWSRAEAGRKRRSGNHSYPKGWLWLLPLANVNSLAGRCSPRRNNRHLLSILSMCCHSWFSCTLSDEYTVITVPGNKYTMNSMPGLKMAMRKLPKKKTKPKSLNKENKLVHTSNGILFSNKKKWMINTKRHGGTYLHIC